MSTPTFYINCRNQGAIITPEQTQQLRDDWFAMWPEMEMYRFPEVDRIEDASKYEKKSKRAKDAETEEVEDDVGIQESETVTRYRACNLVGIWRVDCSKQMALNFPFQSLAAVISKVALWNVFLLSQRDGYKLINFIHESIVDVKESELLEAPPSKVEGNQQPIKESPKSEDMASGKGSTTIPQGSRLRAESKCSAFGNESNDIVCHR